MYFQIIIILYDFILIKINNIKFISFDVLKYRCSFIFNMIWIFNSIDISKLIYLFKKFETDIININILIKTTIQILILYIIISL